MRVGASSRPYKPSKELQTLSNIQYTAQIHFREYTMQFKPYTQNISACKTDCLVLGIYDNKKMTPSAQLINDTTHGLIQKVLKTGDITGQIGQTLLLHSPQGIQAERILLVGCGNAKRLDERNHKRIITTMATALKSFSCKSVLVSLDDLPLPDRDSTWSIRSAILHISDVFYVFDRCKSQKEPEIQLKQIFFALHAKENLKKATQACEQGQAIALGMTDYKNLANLPANICTPTYLAKHAKALAKSYSALQVKVLSEKEMENLGMHCLLSVGKGSTEPSQFIIAEYRGTKEKTAPIVFAGKGVTFDSGGICLKPGPGMEDMKYDMSGAASLLGTLKTICELKLPLHIVALLPCVENMPSGIANKPGDIVTTLSGKTVEVINTDAEGRLILCDTLTYAERYKPKAVIDIATLTGAIVIALGKHFTGMMSNDDELAKALEDAGMDINDRVWRLPITDDYQEQLKSPFADIANVGGKEAGSITAACFLSRFAEKFPWAHLDIAGTAWPLGPTKMATGRPVPLLTQFLLNQLK